MGGVGEDQEDMVAVSTWLMDTLRSEASSVERSGAAQGLAEMCLTMGERKVEQVLIQTLPLQHNPKSAAREVRTLSLC